MVKSDYYLCHAGLSICMKQLDSHWMDFHEILYLSIFRKSVEKISSFIKIWQELLVLYMKTNIHFWSYLTQFYSQNEKCFR